MKIKKLKKKRFKKYLKLEEWRLQELGLGSVWICYFDPEVIRKEFNIPENVEPVNILAIGYAAGEPLSPDRHNKARLPLKNLILSEE